MTPEQRDSLLRTDADDAMRFYRDGYVDGSQQAPGRIFLSRFAQVAYDAGRKHGARFTKYATRNDRVQS